MTMELSNGARVALSRLLDAGFQAYAVGGCVRDTLMSKTPSDFDITTSALPEETKGLFTDFTTFESGITHGTVAVVINGEIVEITTFRSDGEYIDHRHPVGVSFTKHLEDDLSRRDFTVNAMAYNETVGIIDLFGGREDIEKKIIRCVGLAQKRFEEDALRILRALRFSSVLDFEIESLTSRAIHQKAPLLSHVSRERIYVEIKKLLSGRGAERIIREYPDVFQTLFGDIAPDGAAIVRCNSDIVRLALFFYNAPEAFSTLKPSRHDRVLLTSALALSKTTVPFGEVEMKHLIVKHSAECVRVSLEIRLARGEDVTSALLMLNTIVETCDCLGREDLAVGGRDIIALGVKPSEDMGRILDALFEAVLNGEIKNTKEELIAKAKELISDDAGNFLKNS